LVRAYQMSRPTPTTSGPNTTLTTTPRYLAHWSWRLIADLASRASAGQDTSRSVPFSTS
jgi:hypothetical protein